MNLDFYSLGLSVLLLTTSQLNAQFEQPVTRYMEGANTSVYADFDKDGYNDVVIGTRKGAFLIRNHSGLINEELPIQLNNNDEVVLSMDIDGDGYMDILTASSVREGVRWMHNQGNGKFSGEKDLVELTLVKHMLAKDMDGDGDQDLILNTNDNGIVLMRNQGNGEFTGPRKLNNTTATTKPLALDLDGDHDPDLFWNEGNESYWAENLDGRGIMDHSQALFTNGTSIAADLDGDGLNDILTLDVDRKKVLWQKNLGNMTALASKKVLTGGVHSRGELMAVDMEGDGDLDIVFTSDIYDEIFWLENGNGKADFKQPVQIAGDIIDPSFISLFDMDADGDKDLLCGSDGSRSLISVTSKLQLENMIVGRLFHDVDQNGEFNAGDHGLVNRPVGLSDGRTAYTDNNGIYMFPATKGDYIISVQEQEDWVLTTGGYSKNVASLAPKRSSLGNDFGFSAKDEFASVQVALSNGSTRSGMVSPYRVTVTNTGNTQGDVTAQLRLDEGSEFVWSQIQGMASERSVRWDLGPLQPFESRTIEVFLTTNEDAGKELTDVLDASIVTAGGEVASMENKLVREVNDAQEEHLMKASPAGYGVEQAIKWNEELTFTASFTNTTGEAVKHVLIENDMNEWLDLSTLKVVGSSHDHRVYVQADGTVQFYLENANISDEQSDPLNSQVFVSYSVKPLSWIPHNTVVSNKAIAFFGPEHKYETNEVTRVVGESISLGAQDWSALSKTNIVFPNPTNGPTTFDLTSYKHDRVEIHLIDQTGRVIFKREMRGGQVHEYQLASLGKGNYLVRALPLETGEAEFITKLIVQ